MKRLALLCLLALAACDRPQVERVELGEADSVAEPVLSASPDSEGARWTIAANGRALDFGREPGAPYLSLACTIARDAPPKLTIIRHAESEPGAKALFAVLGNGVTSRLYLDAALEKEGWRWEGSYPADAPELDVFTGQRDIEATLPGAGTLHIAGSGLPREFIDWCRRNGEPVENSTVRAEPVEARASNAPSALRQAQDEQL